MASSTRPSKRADTPLEPCDDGAEAVQPGERPLDYTPSQFASLVGRRLLPVLAVRGNEVDIGFGEVFAEGIGIIAAVSDHRHADRENNRLRHAGEHGLGELAGDVGRVGQVVQRCAKAFDHHGDLNAEAAFRGAVAGPPL